MARFVLISSLFAVAFFWAPARLSATFTLGTSVIVNGGAESDAGANNYSTIVPPSDGWVSTGNFTVVRYGASGGFPTTGSPVPFSRGGNFFAGGPTNESSSARQFIDLTNGASIIDGGLALSISGAFSGASSTTVTRPR